MPTEKFILILDSTQLASFSECPQLWDYNYQQRLMPAARKEATPLDMGTYGHKLLEIIYKERIRGTKDSEAIQKAFDFNIDKETCRCGHSHNKHPYVEVDLDGGDEVCTSISCHCKNFEQVTFPLSVEQR